MWIKILIFLIAFNAISGRRHLKKSSGNEMNYDDYGEKTDRAEKFSRKTVTETDELKSSSEEDYDDEAWRKKSSREELLNDIQSLENEVSYLSEGTFSLPKIKAPKILGSIGREILKKYPWIRNINRIVTSQGRNLIFETANINGDRETLVLRTGHEYEYGRYYPMDNDGKWSETERLALNYLQGSSICQQTRAYRGSYICVKALDADLRVLPQTSPSHAFWDKLCLQVYLPVWRYGYEFCYGVNRDDPETIHVQDRPENRWYRKMRTFVFNGGTYNNWIPMYIQDNN